MHVAVIFMVMVIFIQQLPLDKCVISETIVNVTAVFPLSSILGHASISRGEIPSEI